MKPKRRVLYSPGYGAGWVSWNTALIEGKEKECQQLLLTWPPLIEAVLRKEAITADHPAIQSLLATLYLMGMPKEEERLYTGGLRDLAVAEGYGDCRITEYDGSESVVWRGEELDEWL